jgi:hypothetical protein
MLTAHALANLPVLLQLIDGHGLISICQERDMSAPSHPRPRHP